MTDEKEGAGWAAGAKSDAFKAVEASLHIDRSPPNVQPASLVAAMMLAERLPVLDDDTEYLDDYGRVRRKPPCKRQPPHGCVCKDEYE